MRPSPDLPYVFQPPPPPREDPEEAREKDEAYRQRRWYGKKRVLIPLGLVLVGLGVGLLLYLAWARQQREIRLADAERAAMAAYVDSLEAALPFSSVGTLSAREAGLLRRSRNAAHVEKGQTLGITPLATRADAEEGVADLQRISSENPYYRVRRMTHSVPYLTRDAAALLDTIGVRFQRRLAAAGLPPYRFTISSGLRTTEDQQKLTRVNVNAARGRSSHEFGTTFDVQFEQYDYAAAPELPWEPPRPYLRDEFVAALDETYDALGEEYKDHLRALLGRTLIELEDEGKLLVVMERRQPVYHITVGRRLASS